MGAIKPFKTYSQQVDLLRSRGMQIEDPDEAKRVLQKLNYYRLSGYWHTMREIDPVTGTSQNRFRSGATFSLVVDLYEFDEALRSATFACLTRIELAMRALIGYHLGQIDPLIHLDANKLNKLAQRRDKYQKNRTIHDIWKEKYLSAVKQSKEDFVLHHWNNYDGKLPIWVAVEVMNWGLLSHLYRISPNHVRNAVAQQCNLNAPQLESWLRSLNILRNYAAHHARIFNRGFDIKPKLSTDYLLTSVKTSMNRAFGQITLVLYLHQQLHLGDTSSLQQVFHSFPENELVPFQRTGAPNDWETHPLWQSDNPSYSTKP